MGEDTTSLSLQAQVTFIINIIINSIACLLTVLLNMLVIMAVKRRPRLQSNTNILLACLAATDVTTGLLVQPSYILYMIAKLFGMTAEDTEFEDTVMNFHNSVIRIVLVCSSLHLMLVTCERLTAIKFTMHYHHIVTKQKFKVAVIVFWILPISSEVLTYTIDQPLFSNILAALALLSCILFVSISYVLLYRETRRHKKRIKAQQLPQEEVERFAKESRAFKTILFVVGAVILCLLPAAVSFLFVLYMPGDVLGQSSLFFKLVPWIRTSCMFNSLLNPLIYCWRQQEMRKFVFRFATIQAVHAAN